MTSEKETDEQDKTFQTLEEICRNTRAIRSDVNKILDHLQEYEDRDNDYDPDSVTWKDLYNHDDPYY